MAQCYRRGHLGILGWARSNGCQWNRHTFLHCCLPGIRNRGLRQWARSTYHSWQKTVCSGAVKVGIWAFSGGRGRTDFHETSRRAPALGCIRTRLLQWAWPKGCLWNKWTYFLGASGAYLGAFSIERVVKRIPLERREMIHGCDEGNLIILRLAQFKGHAPGTVRRVLFCCRWRKTRRFSVGEVRRVLSCGHDLGLPEGYILAFTCGPKPNAFVGNLRRGPRRASRLPSVGGFQRMSSGRKHVLGGRR